MLRPLSAATASGHAALAPSRVAALAGILAGILALAVPLAGSARATAVFTGTMDGPAAGTDSPATGTIELVLDDAQTTVTYEITYRNLTGEEFEAHFHAGPPGSFSPPIHHLPLGTPKTGTWEPSDRQVASLLDGEISVMIHTDLYPEGEIGGWAQAESAPVDRATWQAVKDLFR